MGQILRFKQHNLADEISAFLIPHPDAAIDSDRAAHLGDVKAAAYHQILEQIAILLFLLDPLTCQPITAPASITGRLTAQQQRSLAWPAEDSLARYPTDLARGAFEAIPLHADL